MSEVPGSERRSSRRGGCGLGCGGFLFVLIVGIGLSLFNVDVAIGISVRIPFTSSNLTLAGAIGAKDKTIDAMPPYTRGRLGGNQNFVNQSQTLTIGPAEGALLLVLGRQDSAPVFDLRLAAP